MLPTNAYDPQSGSHRFLDYFLFENDSKISYLIVNKYNAAITVAPPAAGYPQYPGPGAYPSGDTVVHAPPPGGNYILPSSSSTCSY